MIKFNRKFHPRKIKLLIFDLDGTLIDSRLDLVHSVGRSLASSQATSPSIWELPTP